MSQFSVYPLLSFHLNLRPLPYTEQWFLPEWLTNLPGEMYLSFSGFMGFFKYICFAFLTHLLTLLSHTNFQEFVRGSDTRLSEFDWFALMSGLHWWIPLNSVTIYIYIYLYRESERERENKKTFFFCSAHFVNTFLFSSGRHKMQCTLIERPRPEIILVSFT